jgi:hypothetical protein
VGLSQLEAGDEPEDRRPAAGPVPCALWRPGPAQQRGGACNPEAGWLALPPRAACSTDAATPATVRLPPARLRGPLALR